MGGHCIRSDRSTCAPPDCNRSLRAGATALGPDALIADEPRLGHGFRLHGGNLEVALGAHRVQTGRGLHGRVLLEVDAVRALGQRQEVRVALVQAELHGAVRRGGQLPDGVDGGARGGVEVAAVIDLVSDMPREALEERGAPPVEHRLVHASEATRQQFHARSLVDAAGLRAENAVLQRLGDAEAVAAGDRVRGLQDVDGLHLLAVDGHATAALEPERDRLLLVRRVLRPDAHDGVHDGHRRLH
mmetsp:Transcript_86958/g.251166  ORF Transcript_86958/g.251166 Transcript_86958/m.251166 type:complete len:244 (+) Transcript_86958:79-810(+)